MRSYPGPRPAPYVRWWLLYLALVWAVVFAVLGWAP